MNGSNAIIDGKIIYRYPIPENVVDVMIKFSKRLKFGLTLIEENEGHINYVDDRVISAHEKYGTRFPQPRHYPDHYDRVVYQMIAFCDELDESLFLPHLKECKSARWDEYAVDIMLKDSDKAKGILNGELPDLTENAFELAKQRDIKVIGKQLKAVYESVLKK